MLLILQIILFACGFFRAAAGLCGEREEGGRGCMGWWLWEEIIIDRFFMRKLSNNRLLSAISSALALIRLQTQQQLHKQ